MLSSLNQNLNDDKPEIYYFNDIYSKSKYINIENNDKYYYNDIYKQGQLKLLLNEIRFLSEDVQIHNLKNEKIIILYIGSGKGYHIPYLINSYDNNNIIWYFYDPVGHCKKLYNLASINSNIIIKDQYFIENDIEFFKDIKKKIIFISDIRTSDDVEPNIINLVNDYKLQNNILKNIKPIFSLLKFRLPFPDQWIDDNTFIEKPLGKEYIQPFLKNKSTEFRIMLSSVIIFKKIKFNDLIDYEEKFSWYNNYSRFQNDNDLKIAIYILNLYYKIYDKNIILNNSNILFHIKNNIIINF